jgi:hypothetical protein
LPRFEEPEEVEPPGKMRISTSSWNLTGNPIHDRRHQSMEMEHNRKAREKDRSASTTPTVDPLDLAPAVADRIKAFEDLIRRSSRFDAASANEDDENAGNNRKKRSQSCPARNGMPNSVDSRSLQLTFQPDQQTTIPHKPLLRRTGLLDHSSGRNSSSHLSLFTCGSSSSGYTSTTPPSPEPELSPNRYIFLMAQPAISGCFDKDDGHDDGQEEELEDEDKQIELEIFSRHPSNASQAGQMDRRLFSATSSDDEADVDEEDMDDIRWSDLESEMDLDQVVDILIQSKTSNEVRLDGDGRPHTSWANFFPPHLPGIISICFLLLSFFDCFYGKLFCL